MTTESSFTFEGFNISMEKISSVWIEHEIDVYDMKYNGKLFMKEIENSIFAFCEKNFKIIELWFDDKNKCFIATIECTCVFCIWSFKLDGFDFKVLGDHKCMYEDGDEMYEETTNKDLETMGWYKDLKMMEWLSHDTISIYHT